MIVAVMAAAVALGFAQQTDTTFAVSASGRLVVDAYDGSAIVRAWDRQEMRVQATHGSRVRIRIRHNASGVVIEPELRNGSPPTGVALEITVPRAYGVSIDGVNISANVDGVQGNVSVDNVQGAITIRNVTGNVTVESVSGKILLEDIIGDISAETVEQSLFIHRARGAIDAENVNGGIVITGSDASRLSATTHNGLLQYDGNVRDNGRYELSAYNGQITMSIPENANATVRLSTHTGRIDAAFPVPVRSTRDNQIGFTLGNGSARIDIESHNGTIRLVRPGGR